MPYTRPIPDREPGGKPSGLFGAYVQAEKLLQIALVLPSAAFIGWLAGAWLDSRFHQSWIGIAGIAFGGISGLIYVVRLALAAGRDPQLGGAGKTGKESGKGKS